MSIVFAAVTRVLHVKWTRCGAKGADLLLFVRQQQGGGDVHVTVFPNAPRFSGPRFRNARCPRAFIYKKGSGGRTVSIFWTFVLDWRCGAPWAAFVLSLLSAWLRRLPPRTTSYVSRLFFSCTFLLNRKVSRFRSLFHQSVQTERTQIERMHLEHGERDATETS